MGRWLRREALRPKRSLRIPSGRFSSSTIRVAGSGKSADIPSIVAGATLTPNMRLADFILDRVIVILSRWEEFARRLLPAAADMRTLALRDSAQQILTAIAGQGAIGRLRQRKFPCDASEGCRDCQADRFSIRLNAISRRVTRRAPSGSDP